jgi:hypothetical protein
MLGGMPRVPVELSARRAFACRISPDRWLETLDEAHAFLADRQMLTITASSSLPSVFGACAPNPDPLARGYASWPPDKWWWPGALTEDAGVRRTRLAGGHVLLVTSGLFASIAPLCLHELARADAGEYGADAQHLVRFLDSAGATVLGDARAALGWSSQTMARTRTTLESVGAVMSDDIEFPARKGGHIHTSRLSRVDQLVGADPAASDDAAHRQLLRSAVRAAVVAPRKEVERWFAWPATAVVDALLSEGHLDLIDNHWLSVGAARG